MQPKRKTNSDHLGAEHSVSGYDSVLTFCEIPSYPFHTNPKPVSEDCYTCNQTTPKVIFCALPRKEKNSAEKLYQTKIYPDFRNRKKWKRV